jgi:hypothetical protein
VKNVQLQSIDNNRQGGVKNVQLQSTDNNRQGGVRNVQLQTTTDMYKGGVRNVQLQTTIQTTTAFIGTKRFQVLLILYRSLYIIHTAVAVH